MIKQTFDAKKSLFIPFIMAGHPNLHSTMAAIFALVEAGADIIELGIPFSDPIADGLINQKAAMKAIENGTNLTAVINLVEKVRQLGCEIPILLFSYLNPVLVLGYEKFCKSARSSGVNGVLIVDLPPEEGVGFYKTALREGLETVLFVSPTTDHARLTAYPSLKPSFIYYISRLAVTGIQQDVSCSLDLEIANLRKDLPHTKIAVGFGVSSISQARHIAKVADGVIVGSKLVATLDSCGINEFKRVAKSFAKSIHGVLR